MDYKFQKTMNEAKKAYAKAETLSAKASKEWHEELKSCLNIPEDSSSLNKEEEMILCAGQTENGGWIKFSWVWSRYNKSWAILFGSSAPGLECNLEVLNKARDLWFKNPSWHQPV